MNVTPKTTVDEVIQYFCDIASQGETPLLDKEQIILDYKMTLSPWEEDGSLPANLVRKDYKGNVIAIIDRWMCKYVNQRRPPMIGWHIKEGNASWCDTYNTSSLSADAISAKMKHLQITVDEALIEHTAYILA